MDERAVYGNARVYEKSGIEDGNEKVESILRENHLIMRLNERTRTNRRKGMRKKKKTRVNLRRPISRYTNIESRIMSFIVMSS